MISLVNSYSGTASTALSLLQNAAAANAGQTDSATQSATSSNVSSSAQSAISGNTLFGIIAAANRIQQSNSTSDNATSGIQNDPYYQKNYTMEGVKQNVIAELKDMFSDVKDGESDLGLSAKDISDLKAALNNNSISFTEMNSIPGADGVSSYNVITNGAGVAIGNSVSESFNEDVVAKYTNNSRCIASPAYGWHGPNFGGFLITW